MSKADWIYKGMELVVCLLEGYLYYRVWSHFLTLKQQRKKRAAAVVAEAEFLIFLLNGLGFPVLNLLAAVTIHLAVCLLLFDGGKGKRIYLTVFVWFILGFSEFFVLFILNMALGWKTVYASYGVGGFIFAAVTTKSTAYGIALLFCRSFSPVMKETERKIMAVFILFPIASIVLFAGLAFLDMQLSGGVESRLFLGFGSLLIFVLNLFILDIYGRISRLTNQAKSYERMDTKNELLNVQYTKTEGLKQQIHNVGNQMKTIQILAMQNQNAKIVELTKQWSKTIGELTDDRFCMSETLNAILNEKKMEGQQAGIEVELFVEPGFAMDRIREQDVIGILGNLLDNAIEAAKQREGDGWLKAALYRANEGEILFIRVENNFRSAPVWENGQFLTQKDDVAHHGYGTRYVQDTVKQYGGVCRFEADDTIFKVVIMLPVK